MNRKGFTTVELIVSFTLVSIILVVLMGIILNYRNRIMIEDKKSMILDFKNQITKMVYDDIINGKYQRITSCNEQKCVKFIDWENQSYEMKIVDNYLIYQEKKYLIPDNKNLIIDNFEIENSGELSHVKIPIKHKDLKEDYSILININ